MRSNGTTGCTFQQALTPDAACVVKQAVTLARRRGHAQVTPLHVASTMLSSSSSSGLFRSACQQSHSHPLQCRALELCFNVALNRLPTTTAASASSPPMSPMLGGGQPLSMISHHHQYQQQSQSPSISNALVAAFKRAQAHQRRGSIENQQQPLLAVKIELEQLVISILDDPSVSRVMREAGFSSTLVKVRVEQAVSTLETTTSSSDFKSNNNVDASSCNKSVSVTNTNDSSNLTSAATAITPGLFGVIKGDISTSRAAIDEATRSEDAMRVIEGLVECRRKRSSCVVIIGECLDTLQAAIERAMGKLERGDMDVPDPLTEVKLVPFSLGVFQHLSSEGVTQKVSEIKSLVKNSSVSKKGVVFYLGDLELATTKLMVDYSDRCGGGEEVMTGSRYCPIKHVIMELRRLVLEFSDESGVRLWLVGIATFQTYTKCRGENPNSLESFWGLHAVTIPAGSLRLSLVAECDQHSSHPLTSEKVVGVKALLTTEGKQREDKATTQTSFSTSSRQTCCNIEPSAKSSSSNSSSSLPSWLQKCKDDHENQKSQSNDDDNRRHLETTVPVDDLCKRWINSSACSLTHISHPAHESLERTTLSFSMGSPSSALSFPQYCHFNSPPHSYNNQVVAHQPKCFWFSGNNNLDDQQPRNIKGMERTPLITMYIPDPHQNHMPILSSSSSTPNLMTSLSSTVSSRFKECNAENLKTLCNALERKVPWQKVIIPDVASTILHCRGGRVKRLGVNNSLEVKEETWLFFLGGDGVGKEQIGRQLASLVFGSSSSKFISIGLSSFSPSTRMINSDPRNKRLRNELSCSYLERLIDAVSSDPHRVFFLEDIEQIDYCSQMGLKRACETGKLRRLSGEEVGLGDSIVILNSCDQSLSSRSRACSPSTKQRLDCYSSMEDKQGGSGSFNGSLDDSPILSLDLNLSISDDHCGGNDHDRLLSSSNNVDDVGLVAAVDKCIVFKCTKELV